MSSWYMLHSSLNNYAEWSNQTKKFFLSIHTLQVSYIHFYKKKHNHQWKKLIQWLLGNKVDRGELLRAWQKCRVMDVLVTLILSMVFPYMHMSKFIRLFNLNGHTLLLANKISKEALNFKKCCPSENITETVERRKNKKAMDLFN